MSNIIKQDGSGSVQASSKLLCIMLDVCPLNLALIFSLTLDRPRKLNGLNTNSSLSIVMSVRHWTILPHAPIRAGPGRARVATRSRPADTNAAPIHRVHGLLHF